MRIKVFSVVDAVAGRPPAFEVDDASLSVRVCHDGHWYALAIDADGKLSLRAVGGGQLVIRPCVSNVVYLDVDGGAE